MNPEVQIGKNRGPGWCPDELPAIWFDKTNKRLNRKTRQLRRRHAAYIKSQHVDYWAKYFLVFVPVMSIMAVLVAFYAQPPRFYPIVYGLVLLAVLGAHYVWRRRIAKTLYYSTFTSLRIGYFGDAVMFEGDVEWTALDNAFKKHGFVLQNLYHHKNVAKLIAFYLSQTSEWRRQARLQVGTGQEGPVAHIKKNAEATVEVIISRLNSAG